MSPSTSSKPFPSPQLTLYAQVSSWCARGELDRAGIALAQAYSTAPPQTLTRDDGRALAALADDLVYVGQLLPSLQPTLDLLHHLHGICGKLPSGSRVSWANVFGALT